MYFDFLIHICKSRESSKFYKNQKFLLELSKAKKNIDFYLYEFLSTVKHVTGKDPLERHRGVFTASVGAFYLERPLKSCWNLCGFSR